MDEIVIPLQILSALNCETREKLLLEELLPAPRQNFGEACESQSGRSLV